MGDAKRCKETHTDVQRCRDRGGIDVVYDCWTDRSVDHGLEMDGSIGRCSYSYCCCLLSIQISHKLQRILTKLHRTLKGQLLLVSAQSRIQTRRSPTQGKGQAWIMGAFQVLESFKAGRY